MDTIIQGPDDDERNKEKRKKPTGMLNFIISLVTSALEPI